MMNSAAGEEANHNSNNNSNNNTGNYDKDDYLGRDGFDERIFSFMVASEEDKESHKSERVGDGEEYRLQFPWKRIAYIVVLLILGITCAILALLKAFGSADWMSTATFAVIIMGAVMLLPPGLYYGRILICICCRCEEYTLWDVPAGPFG